MESTFLRRIVENCERYPERIAIVDNDGKRETTYGELLHLARQTGAFLQQKGIQRSAFVTILLPPCAEYMAVEIGLWLNGCVAVPMGDHFPQDRIDFIVEHCGSALTVSEEVLCSIRQMSLPDGIEDDDISFPDTDEPAILIYTSGSTGKPKGILHNHSTLEGNCPRMPREFAPDEKTRFGAASPFYFVTIIGSYDVLHGGGAVHILADHRKASAQAIGEYIEMHGITLCHISPAVLLQFHNTSASLHAVITGGEKLTAQHSQEGYKLFNMFGMSETGGAVMSYEVEKPSDSAPLGIGINQNIARVVDEEGNDAPIDTDGELVLRGHFCAGYFKDPERTQSLYRDGWLHTGDVARRDVHGIIHYVNRKDWMLKINGQRVEPGEIEAVMKRMPGIKQAVVQGIDNGRGSKYLCGYYITKTENLHLTKEEISAYLEQHLPHYMVPLRYVEMEAFPLNANGKIDRKSLPLPQVDRSRLVPLEGETERRVAELFCQVLGMDMADIGRDTNFFEEGGDSIRIMTLCGEVRKAFDREVPPARIYEQPTVKGIAHTIDTSEADGAPLDFVYSDHPDKAPLVFIHTGSTGSEAYYALAGDIKDCCSFSVIEQYNIYHPDDVQEGIPAIAAKYIEILKKRQPHGPYNLGGWCYGGMIAYEMACQLREAGEDMGSLILIDSYIMNSDYDRQLAIRNQVERVDREYYETNPLFENIRAMGLLESVIDNSRRVAQNMVDFQPRPYNGRVHFFKAQDMAKNLPVEGRTYFAHIVRERAGGLEKFIPDNLLTIYEIREHHDGMMSDVGRKVISNRIRNIMGTEALYKRVEEYWSRTMVEN